MPFADILAKINDEAERTQLASFAEKYPELKSSVDRATELDTQLAALRTEHQQAIEQNSRWNQWAADNFDMEAGATRAELAYRRELEGKNATIQHLQGLVGSGEDMNFDEILNQFQTPETARKAGLARAEDVQGLQTNFEKMLETRATQFGTTLEQMDIGFQAALDASIAAQYRFSKEFDQPLRASEFLQHARSRGITFADAADVDKAYESFVAPQRAERRVKELEAKVELAKQEGFQAGQEAASMAHNNIGMPVDAGQGGPMSPLMRNIATRNSAEANFGDKPAVDTSGQRLGSGMTAMLAARG